MSGFRLILLLFVIGFLVISVLIGIKFFGNVSEVLDQRREAQEIARQAREEAKAIQALLSIYDESLLTAISAQDLRRVLLFVEGLYLTCEAGSTAASYRLVAAASKNNEVLENLSKDLSSFSSENLKRQCRPLLTRSMEFLMTSDRIKVAESMIDIASQRNKESATVRIENYEAALAHRTFFTWSYNNAHYLISPLIISEIVGNGFTFEKQLSVARVVVDASFDEALGTLLLFRSVKDSEGALGIIFTDSQWAERARVSDVIWAAEERAWRQVMCRDDLTCFGNDHDYVRTMSSSSMSILYDEAMSSEIDYTGLFADSGGGRDFFSIAACERLLEARVRDAVRGGITVDNPETFFEMDCKSARRAATALGEPRYYLAPSTFDGKSSGIVLEHWFNDPARSGGQTLFQTFVPTEIVRQSVRADLRGFFEGEVPH